MYKFSQNLKELVITGAICTFQLREYQTASETCWVAKTSMSLASFVNFGVLKEDFSPRLPHIGLKLLEITDSAIQFSYTLVNSLIIRD